MPSETEELPQVFVCFCTRCLHAFLAREPGVPICLPCFIDTDGGLNAN